MDVGLEGKRGAHGTLSLQQAFLGVGHIDIRKWHALSAWLGMPRHIKELAADLQ